MPSPSCSPDPRVRAVAGSHNLRDLGGLPTRTGERVRTGRIFRSDYPAFADADAQAAAELGLRTVVDLRRGHEAALECVDWAGRGVAYHRWPLTAGRDDPWHARYSSYLVRRPETVVGAVRTLMSPERHPALFHCAAGKDRTGVVAAVLLSVLGVDDEVIVEDYLLSAPSVERVLARLLGMELYATMLEGDTAADQEPREEHIRSLLGWLDERGGAEAWLRAHGTAETELAAFRDAMLAGRRPEDRR